MKGKQQAPAMGVSALNPAARMLTVQAAAEYLGCTKWQVRSLIWAKEIPCIVLGKRQVIDRADLDRFIENRKAAA